MDIELFHQIINFFVEPAGGCTLRYDRDGHAIITDDDNSSLWPENIHSFLESAKQGMFGPHCSYPIYLVQDSHHLNHYIFKLNSGWLAVSLPLYFDLGSVVNGLPVGVMKTDSSFNLIYFNDQTCHLLGLGPDELPGRGWMSVFEEDIDSTFQEFYLQIAKGESHALSKKVSIISPLGKRRTLSVDVIPQFEASLKIQSFIHVLTDVTREHETTRELKYLVSHDGLTRLSNREFLLEKIQSAHDSNGLENSLLAFIDLNEFKPINDRFGHRVGDEVLKIVGERLLHVTRSCDTVARLGGDEFVIFASNIQSQHDVFAFSEKVLKKLNENVSVSGVHHGISASIGIVTAKALANLNLKNAVEVSSEWLRMADMAMYKAKQSDRKVAFYDDRFRKTQIKIQNKNQELRHILDTQCIEIYFQPIYEGGRPSSVEALSRFPECKYHNGVEDIIETAQHSHCSNELFKLMLTRGLSAYAGLLKRFRNDNLHDYCGLSLHLNIDAMQFSQFDFVSKLCAEVNEFELLPGQIYLEITEQALLGSDKLVEQNIVDLKQKGFKISMDDFGTGYSSFQRLMNYPFDELKIDRYFIMRLHQSKKFKSAIKAITLLGQSLDLNILAEGVETEEQLHYVESLNIKSIQGYYYAKPMDMNSLVQFFATLQEEKYESKSFTTLN
ncbi:MAG: EAL domain-containing protein [Pseudomonadales bacterium]|nr:EAL domain-containing protein [Pseudomonadales bacterium]